MVRPRLLGVGCGRASKSVSAPLSTAHEESEVLMQRKAKTATGDDVSAAAPPDESSTAGREPLRKPLRELPKKRMAALDEDDLWRRSEKPEVKLDRVHRVARQRRAAAARASLVSGDPDAPVTLDDSEIERRSGRIPRVDQRVAMRLGLAEAPAARPKTERELDAEDGLDQFEIERRSGRNNRVDRAAAIRRGESPPPEQQGEETRRAYQGRRKGKTPQRQSHQHLRGKGDNTIVLYGVSVTVGRLAANLRVAMDAVLGALDKLGVQRLEGKKSARAKQILDQETAELVAMELGKVVRFEAPKPTKEEVTWDETAIAFLARLEAEAVEAWKAHYPAKPHVDSDEWTELPLRRPIVSVMGHVDHGKTTLLDALRGESTADKEAGGITQRLAAFQVEDVTFIDTPGHAAFKSMRSSSARALDVALVVVAADDGMKPQTLEALRLARDRHAAIVYALTKADKFAEYEMPEVIRRVSDELANAGFPTEADGGDFPMVPVSGKTKAGLDELKQTLALQAEVLDLRSNPSSRAEAVVADALFDKKIGLCLDVLVVWGTLRVGDHVVVGEAYGKVRRLTQKKEAGPSTPSRVVAGLTFAGSQKTVSAGEVLLAVSDDKAAKKIASAKTAYREAKRETETQREISRIRAAAAEAAMAPTVVGSGGKEVKPDPAAALEQQKEDGPVHVPLVIKVESGGEIDAVTSLLESIQSDKVRIEAVGGVGVGAVGRADVEVAATFDAPIYAWNVGLAGPDVKEIVRKGQTDVRRHKIVYALLDDVRAHAESKLPAIPTPNVTAKLEILKVIELNNGTKIAGCKLVDGTLKKSDVIRHVRDGEVLKIDPRGCATLKHFKNDVSTLEQGQECGLGLHDQEISESLQEGDFLEAFHIVQVPQKL